MSTAPDNEFDLEKLFLPSWAQEPSKSYADYQGEGERPGAREGRRGPRPPWREGGPGGGRPRGDRFRGDRGPRPGGDRPPFGDRRGGRRPEGAGGPPRGGGGPERGPRRFEPRERREPPPPPLEINVSLVPEPKGVESLARQIRMTGRAFPLFDIAQMILQKPERHTVQFSIKKDAEGKPVQPLFSCVLDDTLWLTEDEAVAHVLKKHFTTFYQADRTATEPPKGTYTFVAQCGMSGAILGPPNHHDYQNQLRKLHAERYSRLPFEVYKARVRIVRDPEVVKKWVDDQSWKTEYVCLNMPEPLRLATMDAVEKHFRETHKENIIKPVESQTLSGTAARNLRCPALSRTVRQVWEDQKRFPLQIATVLSQQFAGHGLQFFKVNKTVTHVAVARPHYLDMEATPVSDGVRTIVEFINAHPKCTRRLLLEALAPAPVVIPINPAPTAPAEAPASPAVAPEGQPAAEGQAPAETASPVPAAAPAPAPTPVQPPAPTPEQTAVVSDLHWLIHQGHVIEFATGILETAKKPLPKPPKPEKAPEKPAEASTPETGASTETPATTKPAPSPEAATAPAPEAGPSPVPEQLVAPAGEPELPAPEPPVEPVPAPIPDRPEGT